MWDWFFEDLERAPARATSSTPRRRTIRGAEWTPIDRFPRLEAFVRGSYRYVRTIDDIAIYERNPTPLTSYGQPSPRQAE